jgi:hypothetical protein
VNTSKVTHSSRHGKGISGVTLLRFMSRFMVLWPELLSILLWITQSCACHMTETARHAPDQLKTRSSSVGLGMWCRV